MTANEQTLALPTRRLVVASAVGAIAAGGAWAIVSPALGHGNSALLGMWAAGIVIAAMSAGILVLAPWQERPIGLWMVLWLGGTMVRFVVAAGLAWWLYSATSFAAPAVTGAVGGVYFVALLCEVRALATFIHQSEPSSGTGSTD